MVLNAQRMTTASLDGANLERMAKKHVRQNSRIMPNVKVLKIIVENQAIANSNVMQIIDVSLNNVSLNCGVESLGISSSFAPQKLTHKRIICGVE